MRPADLAKTGCLCHTIRAGIGWIAIESGSNVTKQTHKTLPAARAARQQLIDSYKLHDHPNIRDITVGLDHGEYVIKVNLITDEYVYLPEEKFGGCAVVVEVVG